MSRTNYDEDGDRAWDLLWCSALLFSAGVVALAAMAWAIVTEFMG